MNKIYDDDLWTIITFMHTNVPEPSCSNHQNKHLLHKEIQQQLWWLHSNIQLSNGPNVFRQRCVQGIKKNHSYTGLQRNQGKQYLDQNLMMSMCCQHCQCTTQNLCPQGNLQGHHHQLNHLCTAWPSTQTWRKLQSHLNHLLQKDKGAQDGQKFIMKEKVYKIRRGSRQCWKQCTLCHQYFSAQS